MKRKIGNSKGITLIALVITIIVLLILASVATYSGIDVIRSSKFTAFTTEMKIMQTEVNNLYNQWKNGEIAIDETTGNITNTADNSTIGKDLTYNSEVEDQANYVLVEVLSLGDNLSSLTGYKYFDQETIQNLGIEAVEGEFFINIKTRNVVSYDGIEYDGEWYYTLEQLPDGLYNVDYDPQQGLQPTFDVSFEKIGDEKYRITISNIQYDGYIDKWYVKYQEVGGNYWNSTEDMSFVVNKKANYTVYIENGDVKSEEKTVEIIAEEFSRANGEIDVVFLSGKTDKVSNNANAPVLGTNMVPVNFNSSTNKWDEVSESNWEYSYTNTPKESKWANAVVKDGSGNVTGYFVWIPRYAYKITYFQEIEHETIIGYSDARGIVTVNGAEYIGEGRRRKAGDNYVVHPAFTNDIEVGGWDSELEGIWIAKYEANSSNPSTSNGGGNTTNLNVKVLPGITSWRDIQIGNMYTVSRNYSQENNSHLIKNSEWGAVAYLSYSNYGVGKDIKVEQANAGENYYTGGSNQERNIYTTNINQSTTGNVYGIYDMNGGTYERVASYVNSGKQNTTSGVQILIDASNSGSNSEKRTVQVYKASNAGDISIADSREENYMISGQVMFGDALFETSIKAFSEEGAWQVANADFPGGDSLLFTRGGGYKSLKSSIFYFANTKGANLDSHSFRIALSFNLKI